MFDGKLKLIRNSSYMSTPWSNNNSNHWNNSSLKSSLDNYYNYMNSVSKEQVAESVFYLGGLSIVEMYDVTRSELYNIERGTQVWNSNPTSIKQNIGLMYGSDYGYAASEACPDSAKLYSLFGSNSACSTTGNWLYIGNTEWLQTPASHKNTDVLVVNTTGTVSQTSLNAYLATRPVVFLKSTVNIVDGFGTQSNPYILG